MMKRKGGHSMEMKDELLLKLEKASRQQALFTKILCALCAAVLICCLVTTVAVAGTASQLMAVVKRCIIRLYVYS